MTETEKQKSILFAEWCGERADFIPETRLWTYYKDQGTVKKTTIEMLTEYENDTENLLGSG